MTKESRKNVEKRELQDEQVHHELLSGSCKVQIVATHQHRASDRAKDTLQ